jgi:hypothetical protein
MLNGISREVVFFPQVHVLNPIVSVEQKISKNIISGEGLEVFRLPYEVGTYIFVSNRWFQTVHNYSANLKARVRAIRCPKCVRLDWEDIWCNQTEGVCKLIDEERQITGFFDNNHVNAIGSLKVGAYIRRKYDAWLASVIKLSNPV